MGRDDGFPVMDVSSAFLNDPKWRRLHRSSPELFPAALVAYTATLCESWAAGRRVSVEDAWSALLPYDAAVVTALRDAGFLDRKGFIIGASWAKWFRPAHERREKARDRWKRYNAKRDADTTDAPRGSDAVPATSVPPVRPSVLPSGPSRPSVPPSARGAREEHGFKEPRNGRVERISEDLLPEHLRAHR